MSNKENIIFLNILKIKFPINAIFSIFHRISGIIFLLSLPFFLYILNIFKNYNFNNYIKNNIFHIICSIFLIPIIYHTIFGIRHLMMDIGFFEEIQSANKSLFFFFIIFLTIIIGTFLL